MIHQLYTELENDRKIYTAHVKEKYRLLCVSNTSKKRIIHDNNFALKVDNL